MSAPAEALAPMVPRPFRVAARWPEMRGVVTLALEPVGGPPLGFAPGQFTMLYAFGVGEVPISISGRQDGRVLQTIREVGAVTRALCAAEPGEVLGVRGPFGSDWALPAAQGRDVVVVAGGLGVAPLRPAIRGLVADRDRDGRISVLVGARSPDDLLFLDELRALADDPRLHVAVTVDHAEPGWAGPVGVVPELIPDAPFDPSNATALVCGPEVMMRFTAEALLARGVPAERILVSMERNMKCAIGHCGHCQFGPEFVCRDGPIFRYERVRRFIAVREV
ncbi:MAG TPA: FAD/NAD(P)-binding protein [Jiangellaceae bacterium]